MLDQIQTELRKHLPGRVLEAERPASRRRLLADWDDGQVAPGAWRDRSLSILGIDAVPPPELQIRSQPAVELKGRVADWVAEIRRLRDDGESVLFVAATAGRAERSVEVLKEYDVLAIPVERAEDAHYARSPGRGRTPVARLPSA